MVQVLVLNASYEPLRIVDHRRAITLLLGGKVEVVEPSRTGRTVATVSQRIALPSVIRLRRYVNVPQRGAVWSRQAVLARDRMTCVYCGYKLTAKAATTLAPAQTAGAVQVSITSCRCATAAKTTSPRTRGRTRSRHVRRARRGRATACCTSRD